MKCRSFAAFLFIIFLLNEDSLPEVIDLSPWKLLINKEGIRIDFIFYSKGDNYNNGVVIKISNLNDYNVNYSFTLVFKSVDNEKPQTVSGLLLPGEIKTGSEEGLFFIPFKDGRSISEIGIRDFNVNHTKDITQ